MNLRNLTVWLFGGMALMSLCGCDQVAFEPIYGRLRCTWSLNDRLECEVPAGVPVVAKVQVRNIYRWRVRVPLGAGPMVTSGAGVTWKPLRSLPATLGAGEEAEASWLMEGTLSPGKYEVAFAPESAISGALAAFSVSAEPVSKPMILERRAEVARLTGTSADLAEELLLLPPTELLPTTRLVLADLFREAGDPKRASEQLEQFAEEIYGTEGLPSWLQVKMQPLSPDP